MWAIPLALALSSNPMPARLEADRLTPRAQDWRVGPVVYQVFVDRFAPSQNLPAKRHLYPAPKKLHPWTRLPEKGVKDPALGHWTHEIDFWGGDLPAIQEKIPYIQTLGADVLYLTPVFAAYTNHKYDTQDYFQVSPEFGTRQDLRNLVDSLDAKGLHLVLDGVFNHMGRTSPAFQKAQSDPSAPTRPWFKFGPEYPAGYSAWAGVANLPELKLEEPTLQNHLWASSQSVIQTYLQEGVDGWRLDVAFELGPEILAQITAAAHTAKPGSLVVGEISGYPAEWFPAVDGVYNFHALDIARATLEGQVTGGRATRMLQTMVDDAGIENILRSWLHLDNHDTPRLASTVPDRKSRHWLQTLQFSLPGAPVVYYGTELGLTGADDPANRAPMPWHKANDDNPDLAHVRKIAALRKAHPALRYGDFQALESENLIAFARTTGQLRQAVLVIANPTTKRVTETFSTRLGQLLSWGELQDAFTQTRVRSIAGLLSVTVPPRQTLWLTPVTTPAPNAHNPYKRIR